MLRALTATSRSHLGVWRMLGGQLRAASPRYETLTHLRQLSSSGTQLWRAPPAGSASATGAAPLARLLASAAGSSGVSRRPQQLAAAAAREAGLEEDKDADAIGELGESDAFLDDLEAEEEEAAVEVSTGGVQWGEQALEAVQRLLGESKDLALYSFRALPSSRRLDVRLDKLTGRFGSPSLDDIEAFTRRLGAELEAALGEEAAGDIEVEVSSPGAERQVRFPAELSRFAELPMRVEFDAGAATIASTTASTSPAAAPAAAPTTREVAPSSSPSSPSGGAAESQVLEFVGVDEAAGVTRWRLADVRANRSATGRGRSLTRKQREAEWLIPLAALRRVNLHLDI